MITRRQMLKYTGLAMAAGSLPLEKTFAREESGTGNSTFRFSLNTSTISGAKPGMKKMHRYCSQSRV